jgi:uncharacterized membrane protein YphA (DoxX/SURF4 family)
LQRIFFVSAVLLQGVQKVILPDVRGLGRLVKLGVFSPEFTAPFVGTMEIVAESTVVLGLATRLVAIPFFIIMLFAITYTQIPVSQGKGFWEMANKICTGWSMTLVTVFVFLRGIGKWSLDEILSNRISSIQKAKKTS